MQAIKKLNPLNWSLKKLCEKLLVGSAGIEFLIYLILIIIENESSKIVLMGVFSVITAFVGFMFVLFTLIINLKRLHKTSYVILGISAFILRATCLFLTTYFYKNPTEDFFITN